MFRLAPAHAPLLCILVVAGCGDDTTEESGSASGSSSETTPTETESAGTGSSGEGAGTDTPLTGVSPDECAEQQGDGPCMVEFLVELPSSEVAFGDFDDDGDIDLLARSEETGPDGADEAIVFHNDNGQFNGGTTLSFSEAPMASDRAVALSRPRPMGTKPASTRSAFLQGTYGALGDVQVDVWWMRGDSLERFYSPTGSPPAGPWFGDFDGDGNTDLAFAPTATSLDALDIHSCEPQSCGSAQSSAVTGAPAGPWTILGTDTTGDGLDELLVVRDAGEGLEVVVLSNDGGSFAASSTLQLGDDLAPASARLVDVDADGREDLALTTTGSPSENSFGATLRVFTQDGSGGLQAGPVIEAGERITGYDFADFNGDGTPDIALRRTDDAVINVGLGPSFDSGVSYNLTAMDTGIEGQGIPTWATVMTDFDGNGLPDIVTVTAQGTGAYAANVLLASG